ncbi:MAG: DUF4097 family beta strand repeat protein [Candidatus Bipolaricaulota bacterium]|nr:MAG: DUF4097 family beta strand repeat protein [Candidatus Bipolaricaulota bacterium]
MRSRRRILVGILALGVALASAGCIPGEIATRVEQATFAVSGRVDLDVLTSNGQVTVHGVPGATSVDVTATLTSRGNTEAAASSRVRQIEIHMTQTGDRVALVYRAQEQPSAVRSNSGVSFVVTVPVLADVELTTSNGAIEVTGIEGTVGASTSNGRITASSIAGALAADTSNGRIDIDAVHGTITLETSNGAIAMDDVQGAVQAETSNGAIHFAGTFAGDAHRLETSSGLIEVLVHPTASLHFDARTSNGSITATLPLAGDISGDEWSAELNPPATTRVTLRTSNGAITIGALPPATGPNDNGGSQP